MLKEAPTQRRVSPLPTAHGFNVYVTRHTKANHPRHGDGSEARGAPGPDGLPSPVRVPWLWGHFWGPPAEGALRRDTSWTPAPSRPCLRLHAYKPSTLLLSLSQLLRSGLRSS